MAKEPELSHITTRLNNIEDLLRQLLLALARMHQRLDSVCGREPKERNG